MRDLRHRLLDTERQMTRILQAMQDVQEKVADLSGDLSVSAAFYYCALCLSLLPGRAGFFGTPYVCYGYNLS